MYQAGSEWHKWDLHFHTPSSYDYKDKSVTNEEIIDNLKKNNISVVAITDHHIIDIDRIKELQDLANNEITILPAIEFLSDSRGKQPIHFIGIFSEKADLNFIWGQIEHKTDIHKIKSESKNNNEIYCNLEKTIDLIHELGGVVTIHAGEKHSSIENITHSLPHGTAQKTDIANKVDFYELGKASDKVGYEKYVFPSIDKYIPMIICSDNHNIKKYQVNDFCWMKANPTFEGLKQVINEPKDRIFIGKIPNKKMLVSLNKTKYINNIKINKVANSNCDDIWFDSEIKINKDLTVIIGNKGNGKSALADILALCGNAKLIDDTNFSFLNKNRFKKNKLAKNFQAVLTWEDGTTVNKILSDDLNITDVEKIKYLPQKYIETICTNESNSFQSEINKVVFSHISEAEKLGEDSLDKLTKSKTNSLNTQREQLNVVLKALSLRKTFLLKDYSNTEIEKINKLILEKENEIRDHLLYKNENINEVNKPEDDDNIQNEQKLKFKKIERYNSHIKKLDKYLSENQQIINNYTKKLNVLSDSLKSIDFYISEFENFKSKISIEYHKTGIDVNINQVLKLSYEKEILVKEGNDTRESLEKLLKNFEIVIKNKDKKLIEIDNLNAELNDVQKQYQSYIMELSQWEKVHNELILEKEKLEAKIIFKNVELPIEIKTINQSMYYEYKKLFNTFLEELTIYEDLYKPILEFVKDEKEKRNSTLKGFIEFTTSISLDKQKFMNKILDFFDNRRKKFNDEDIQNLLNDDFEINFNNIILLNHKIEKIIKKEKDIEKQFKDSKNITDFYMALWDMNGISIEYDILLDNKNLSQLSPGERGALLIIFYLLIDKSDIPLIIDQPEDNLDNESVFEYLVPYIKRAKQKRQIIIVTHNPNIAVVSDAEQIIYTEISKSNKNRVSYQMGAIESKNINNKITTVLEGTLPAFDNRTKKYFKLI